jgi:hypothetical protein
MFKNYRETGSFIKELPQAWQVFATTTIFRDMTERRFNEADVAAIFERATIAAGPPPSTKEPQ